MDNDVNSSEPLSTWDRTIRLLIGGLLLCFVGKCVDPLWNWPHYQLPPSLKVDAILASNSESGFLEGCRATIYTLAPGPVMQLRREGIGYFNRNWPANEGASNPFGPWRETPGEIDLKRDGYGATNTIFGLRALDGGCRTGEGAFIQPALSEALGKSGSFYTMTGNREGIIIVVPDAKLAAYFYVG